MRTQVTDQVSAEVREHVPYWADRIIYKGPVGQAWAVYRALTSPESIDTSRTVEL